MLKKQNPLVNKEHILFYLIITGFFLSILSPHLFSSGMFMDGLMYAGISKNLANGIGSFWQPQFSQTMFPAFYEHPPLAFGLQSLLFRIFGDSILIENFYSLGTALSTGIIITKIMKIIPANKNLNINWLALLFWIGFPLLSWSIANNMLENTMMIFSTLATYFILKNHISKKAFYLIPAGIALYLAFLTKGLTGLFPLSIPFWFFIFKFDTRFKSFVSQTFILFITLVMSLLITFVIFPESYHFFDNYFQKQVLESIISVKTVNNRFFIVFRLFNELIPSMIIGFLLFLSNRKLKISSKTKKWSLLFFSIGLSGVLPIMISLKQSGFYMVSTFPFFAIGLTLFFSEYANNFLDKIRKKNNYLNILFISAMLIFLTGIMLNIIPHKGRDTDKIHDVQAITKHVGENKIICIDSEIWKDYALYGYFIRYSNISLSRQLDQVFYIKIKGNQSLPPEEYHILPIELNLFELYEHNN
ncbi:MAG: glycosyltransferase family 39 protein [Bacteroidales bacterium]|nr:glycosyltransferase family 39 protein [Bacteroidales bacterium]